MSTRNILTIALSVAILAVPSSGGGGPPQRVVVYVTSQGLYYDSIITADPLPPVGPFQLLEMGPNGLETELGKGDPGYVGGRWKEDFDGDGVFHYFLCPLIGKGRTNP